MRLTVENMTMLGNATTEEKWNAACDAIKREHGGYPADWYEKVIATGLLKRTLAVFGASDAVTVSVVSRSHGRRDALATN